MSEHVVHTGIVEDSVALMPYLKKIPADFVKAVEKHIGFAKLGSITVSGDRFSFRLLEEYKPLWKNRDDLLEAKLAFVLGWVSHRACDRQMKPLWNIREIFGKGSDADPSISPTECSVYHEGTLFNLYYADNSAYRLAIFPEQLSAWPGAELFNLPLAEKVVESSYGMNMVDIQTFAPPSAPSEAQRFMEDLCVQAQKFYVDVSRYARAAGNPDAERKHAYVKKINWYDDKDPLIALACIVRRGGVLDIAQVEAAMQNPASSQYGQALQMSLGYFVAAAEYFADDNMTMDTLKDRLDIGKLGPNGLGV
jgi:hypothetical protein